MIRMASMAISRSLNSFFHLTNQSLLSREGKIPHKKNIIIANQEPLEEI